MARGKYAARTAKQFEIARDAEVHALRKELTEARRAVEVTKRRAGLVPALEQRVAELQHQIDDDTVMKEFADRADLLAKQWDGYHEYATALRDAFFEVLRDFLRYTPLPGSVDALEYIARRWPKLVDWEPSRVVTLGLGKQGKSLSDDAIKRLQRARGTRLPRFEGRDIADIAVEKYSTNKVSA